jgi:putative endonuclease
VHSEAGVSPFLTGLGHLLPRTTAGVYVAGMSDGTLARSYGKIAWVYLLRCRDGSLYTGWTSDLDRRLARHRAGKGSRYTASRLPVELALAMPMADRTAARREEARIKRLPRADKLALIAASRPGGRRSPAESH